MENGCPNGLFRVIPDNSVDVLDILYPTPWWDRRKRIQRLLLQPSFLLDVHRTLKPGGVIRIETDVEEYAIHIHSLFEQTPGFESASPTLYADRLRCEVLSRRQKKQVRDQLPQWLYHYVKCPIG